METSSQAQVLRRRVSRYVLTGGLVGLVTMVGIPLRKHLADPDLVMLYMLAIGAAAVMFGRGASVAASALSLLAFDFFFVSPFHTFAISDERYLLTFAMMFVVGLLASGLTLRVRKGQMDETRSALLSAVSHDLRTPLATITGAATTLRDSPAALTAEQRAEMLEAICEEAARMERLVGNLLDMTRLQAGALQVKREWVPVEEVIGSALGRVEAVLEGRRVDVRIPEDLPPASADPVLLEQVFVNLLDNAAKHTPGGTPIEVTARATPGAVVIDVADRGPGIPAGSESRLFDTFLRGPHPATQGAGLGLAICRGIVSAHGGTIVAHNRGGGGALFRVRLLVPRDALALPPAGQLEDKQT
jgi:K+-sensing histidine kinase KdpD